MIRLLADLAFGASQSGVPALREGWSAPEAGWVWSLGATSSLVFPVPPAEGELTLELQLGAFVQPPRQPFQRLDVTVNGHALAQLVLGGAGIFRFDVPDELLRGRDELKLAFHHPDAVAPAALGAGQDKRQLAIRLFRLALLQDPVHATLPPRCGPLMLAEEWRFGWNEPTTPMLLQGWGRPENGYVWTAAHQSVLRVTPLNPQAASTIILDLEPFTAPPGLTRQRIGIGAAGENLQYMSLTHRSPVALELPRPAKGADFIDIDLNNFDAALSPGGDGRALAFRLRHALLLQPRPDHCPGHRAARPVAAPEEIVAQFESLGTFCDFGLLQRSLGLEPPGLLRFAGIMTPELVHGIVHGFPCLGRPDTLHFSPRDDDLPGFGIKDDHSTISFRTPPFSPDDTQAMMKRRLAQRLSLLRRKFFEDAAGADKIFLFYREDKTIRAEVDAVLAALSVWGDATLLWLLTDVSQPPGSVVRLGPRLLCGFLPVSSRESPLPYDVLLRSLANALALEA